MNHINGIQATGYQVSGVFFEWVKNNLLYLHKKLCVLNIYLVKGAGMFLSRLFGNKVPYEKTDLNKLSAVIADIEDNSDVWCKTIVLDALEQLESKSARDAQKDRVANQFDRTTLVAQIDNFFASNTGLVQFKICPREEGTFGNKNGATYVAYDRLQFALSCDFTAFLQKTGFDSIVISSLVHSQLAESLKNKGFKPSMYKPVLG